MGGIFLVVGIDGFVDDAGEWSWFYFFEGLGRDGVLWCLGVERGGFLLSFLGFLGFFGRKPVGFIEIEAADEGRNCRERTYKEGDFVTEVFLLVKGFLLEFLLGFFDLYGKIVGFLISRRGDVTFVAARGVATTGAGI